MAVSLDEVTSGESYMGVTVYRINEETWQRERHYLALVHLTDAPNAKYLTNTLVECIVSVTGLSEKEVEEKLVNAAMKGRGQVTLPSHQDSQSNSSNLRGLLGGLGSQPQARAVSGRHEGEKHNAFPGRNGLEGGCLDQLSHI